MEIGGPIRVVEELPDGRQLVEPRGRPGVLAVVGLSNRLPEAARMGYRENRSCRTVVERRPARARRRGDATAGMVAEVERVRTTDAAERIARIRARGAAEVRAEELFASLLDDDQRRQWASHRCCWVATPEGPVRLGRLHDLRFRPLSSPGEERSLCVVPEGPPMPLGDVWTNLLLVLAVDHRRFFAVANLRRRGLSPSRPHPPGVAM
jgi:hypothetical protein